jgi:hypothetical protein
MRRLSAEELAAPALDRVEVYLSRWGGYVVLQELTGPQLAKAAKWARETLPGSDVPTVNPAKFAQLRLALALVEPSLGDTDEAKAANINVIESLPAIESLLLTTVVELMNEGRLSEQQRELLRSELRTPDMLDQLCAPSTPSGVISATPDEQVADLYRAALHVPQVLFGQVPLSVVGEIAAASRQRDAELARMIAMAMLGQATEG